MTSPEENPSPAEVMAEITATRGVLEDLPNRLDAVDKRGQKTLWMVIGTLALIFALAIFFLVNEDRHNSGQNERFDEFAHCQAEYNTTNSAVTRIRAELQSQLNAAQAKRDKRIATLTAGGGGDINKIFLDYSNQLIEIERQRANNPIPAYTDCYEKFIRN